MRLILRALKTVSGQWSAVGAGVNNNVSALEVVEQPQGHTLVVGGSFWQATDAGGTKTVNGIALWDGLAWRALNNGLSGSVYSITAAVDGSGLYVGGLFSTSQAGEQTAQPMNRLGKWSFATETSPAQWQAVGTGMTDRVGVIEALADGSAIYVAGVGGLAKFDTASGEKTVLTNNNFFGFQVLPDQSRLIGINALAEHEQ